MKKIVLPILLAVIMIAAALTASAKTAFTDVPDGSWYRDAVYYCVENKLFSGVTDTTFAPNDGMTRAMFVTVLASQHDFNRDDYKSSSFTDVPAGKWYSVNVEWAYKEGLVAGMGSGTFAPDKVITRAQLATLIRTYAEYLGHDMSAGDGVDLSSYRDAKDVPAWAQDGFKWAIANDVIGGVKSGSDTLLAPSATATRATVAQIMMKLTQLPLIETVDAGEAKMTINGNDISLYKIIKPASPAGKARIDEAADKLQEFIETATGETLPIETDDTEESEYEIIVGDADREGKPETDYSNIEYATPDLSFTVCVKGNKMYFTGAVDAHKRYGTFYSAYYFAEKELGYKFYQDDCILCRPRAEIDIPDGYEFIDGPGYEMRSLYMVGAWEDCLLNDDYNSDVNWVHELYDWVHGTSGTYNAATPCLSDEDNLRIITEKAVAYMGANPSGNGIWVSMNDSDAFCECDKCMAAYREDGSRAATLIRCCNRVSEALKAAYPDRDINVNTLAYNYATMPVKSTVRADNVVVYYCTIKCCPSHAYNDPTCPYNKMVCDHIRRWKDVSRKVYLWDYAADFSYSVMPFADYYSILGSLEGAYESGARGAFINAVDRHCGEFNELRGYLYSKVLRDPHMSEREYFAEMNSFIKDYYGDTGLYLRKYIDVIEELTNDQHFGFNAVQSFVFDYDEVCKRVDEIDALWAKAFAEVEGNETYTMRIDRAMQSWIYLRQSAVYEDVMLHGTPEQQEAYRVANDELYKKIVKYDIGMSEGNGIGGYDRSNAPDRWSRY